MVGTPKQVTALQRTKASKMSATIASTLIDIIATAQHELGKIGGATGSSKKGAKKAETKVSTRKGRPTAHGDFTKKILEDHKAEKDAFIAERVAKAAAGELLYTAEDASVKKGKHAAGDAYTEEEAKKGAHLNFIAAYKSQHKDEYTAFEAAWKEAHPKGASANESEEESILMLIAPSSVWLHDASVTVYCTVRLLVPTTKPLTVAVWLAASVTVTL